MNLFTKIANLLVALVQPAKPAYTTVIYPSQGKAVVVHDGLGIRHERPWYRIDSLIDENMDTSMAFDSILHDHTGWADSFDPVHPIQTEEISSIFSSHFEPATSWVNPANGMPMLDSCFDVMGNTFGTDMLSDSLSFDHGISCFESSFSSFGFD